MPNRKPKYLPTLGPVLLAPFRFFTIKRLFRIAKWSGCTLLLLGALLTLLYFVENRRGKSEWNKIKAAVEAKGISLNWADYIPDSIPDDINFVETPVVAYFQYDPDHPHYRPWQDRWGNESDFKQLFRFEGGGVKASESFILKGEQIWHESRFEQNDRRRERFREEGGSIIPEGMDPWEQLDAQIAPHRQLLDDLRKAARMRSESYIHDDYSKSPFEAPMPSFQHVRNLAHLLFADSLLALRQGDVHIALENAYCIERLADLNPGMYFLVNAMIDVVATKGFEIPIYQVALRDDVLDNEQLRGLVEMSLQRHALADFEWGMHHEIAGGAEAVLRDFKPEMFFLSALVAQSPWDKFIGSALETVFRAMPEGWGYIMVSRNVYYTSLVLEPYDVATRSLDLEEMERNRQTIEEMIQEARFFNLLAAMAIPAFSKVTETTLTLQCQQDMLGIASALELYRRANDDLPVSLDILVPDFIVALHKDPVSGKDYRYERIDQKTFRLWAVGIDGMDDGGILEPNIRESDQADIVWPLSYPHSF
jgi:hypothetical protein